MVVNKKIAASGIAEVVVALAIIAMCFTVAALVFIRANSTPMRFQDVKLQTEIQSQVLQKMFLQQTLSDLEPNEILEDENLEEVSVLRFTGSDNRLLWEQQSNIVNR